MVALAKNEVVRVDDVEWRNALRKLERLEGGGMRKGLRQQGRLLAVNLAFESWPIGKRKSDVSYLRSVNAIRGDVKKVYLTPGDVYVILEKNDRKLAGAFWGLFKKKKFRKLERLLQDSGISDLRGLKVGTFDKSLHAKARSGKRNRVKASGSSRMMVTNGKRVQSFIKKAVKRIGYAKSGWAAVAKLLGGSRGIPGFVSRLSGAGSVVDRSGSKQKPTIIMSNDVNYASEVLGRGGVNRAIRIQKEKFVKFVESTVRKSARISGFRVR